MTTFSDALRKIRSSVGDIKGEVDRVRLDRLRLLQERDAAEGAPLTDAEIIKRVAAAIDAAEDVARKNANMAPFYVQRGAGMVEGLDKTGLAAIIGDNPLGALALLGLRALIEPALVVEAKRSRRGEPASEKVRNGKLAALAKELHALEIAEEQLIRACEGAGITVSRRVDASPEIMLREDI